MNVAIRVGNQPLRELFMLDLTDPLKDMAQRPMPQVMQQRGGEADRLGLLVDHMRQPQLRQHLPRRFHDAQAMAVSGMIRPRIRQRRHPQLHDPAKALELGGVHQLE